MDGRPFSLRQDVESETPARTSEPGGGEALRHEPRSGYPYAGGTADVLAVRVPPGGSDHVRALPRGRKASPSRTSAPKKPQSYQGLIKQKRHRPHHPGMLPFWTDNGVDPVVFSNGAVCTKNGMSSQIPGSSCDGNAPPRVHQVHRPRPGSVEHGHAWLWGFGGGASRCRAALQAHACDRNA